MTMKHFNTLALLLALFISTTALAQPGGGEPRGEVVEQLRIAFLTEELNLTTEEGQQFWPVFNEFNDQRRKLQLESRIARQQLAQKPNPTEADVMKAAKAEADMHRQEAVLIEDFIAKAMDVLGPERTVKLMQSEEKFKRRMLKRLQDRRR